MEGHPSEYMRLGINHHMLFPASLTDPVQHEETLPQALSLPGFEIVDLFLGTGAEQQQREKALVLGSGRAVVYNFPILAKAIWEKGSGAALQAATEHIAAVLELGAEKGVVASGPDRGVSLRAQEQARFLEYLVGVAEQLESVPVLIEPFDRSIDKNFIVGPTREAVEIVEQARDKGAANVGLMVDMGHLPLLGEEFGEAVALSAPYLGHAHLGNCVMRDPDNPFYGDKHPFLGIRGGENDVEELRQFLHALVEVGYLGTGQRPSVTFEIRPCPGKSPQESASLALEKLSEAWRDLEP